MFVGDIMTASSLSLVRFVATTVCFLVAVSSSAAAADAALVDAVKRTDVAAVRSLLSAGADVDEPEADGTTALHWAAYRDNADIAALLLEAGASATSTNRYGVQPISLAAVNGSAAIILALLDAGADVNTTLAEGETVLMTAARTGNLAAVELLLAHGADINAAESWRRQTALMWAAAEGHIDVIRALVAHDVDVHAASEKAFTALMFAAREGHIEVAEALLDAGASLNEALTVNALRTAGNLEREAASAAGVNAFLLAVGNAHYELAARLLDRGADPNAAPRGWTVLHQLTWVRKAGISGSNDPPPEGSGEMDSLELVRKLVAAGADINARVTKRPPAGISVLNFAGGTPFLLAARTADAEYMRLLVELGADPLLTNDDGSTPLMVAAGLGASSPGEDPGTESEVIEAVRLALELGDDINAVDLKGETAMHGAAYKAVPRVVRLLSGEGADMEIWNQANGKGWSPLTIAEGVHRGANIITSLPTAAAIREVMAGERVEPGEIPPAAAACCA